jgi:hypothetical protein
VDELITTSILRFRGYFDGKGKGFLLIDGDFLAKLGFSSTVKDVIKFTTGKFKALGDRSCEKIGK